LGFRQKTQIKDIVKQTIKQGKENSMQYWEYQLKNVFKLIKFGIFFLFYNNNFS
jgi:hypothetical protein